MFIFCDLKKNTQKVINFFPQIKASNLDQHFHPNQICIFRVDVSEFSENRFTMLILLLYIFPIQVLEASFEIARYKS